MDAMESPASFILGHHLTPGPRHAAGTTSWQGWSRTRHFGWRRGSPYQDQDQDHRRIGIESKHSYPWSTDRSIWWKVVEMVARGEASLARQQRSDCELAVMERVLGMIHWMKRTRIVVSLIQGVAEASYSAIGQGYPRIATAALGSFGGCFRYSPC